MDLSDYFYKGQLTAQNRGFVSLTSGFLILVGNFVAEQIFAPETDFGFWLYLFGLLAFWFGVIYATDNKVTPFTTGIFTIVQVILIELSQEYMLDRYMFALFGFVGLVGTFTQFAQTMFSPQFHTFWLCVRYVCALGLLFFSASETSLEISCTSTKAAAFLAALYALSSCHYVYQNVVVFYTSIFLRFGVLALSIGLIYAAPLFQMTIVIPSLFGYSLPLQAWMLLLIVDRKSVV